MIELDPGWPDRVRLLLSKFDLARGERKRRGFVLPHPGRPDNHPSVWLTVSPDGALLLKDRTGKPTLDILTSIGADWPDLYPADDGERLEIEAFARTLDASISPGGRQGLDPTVADLRHRVYSALLAELDLSDGHYEQLTTRGLSPGVIARNEYRTLRVVDRARVAKRLHATFGGVVATIPGFAAKGGQLTLSTVGGMLIPVRSLDGRIQAIKVRRDDATRYSWLGTGDVLYPHFPLGSSALTPPVEQLAVTEGELKADVAFVKHKLLVFSVPGVSNWRLALGPLADLRVRTVQLAFDRSADPERQREIDRHTNELADQLEQSGYDVEELTWDVTPA